MGLFRLSRSSPYLLAGIAIFMAGALSLAFYFRMYGFGQKPEVVFRPLEFTPIQGARVERARFVLQQIGWTSTTLPISASVATLPLGQDAEWKAVHGAELMKLENADLCDVSGCTFALTPLDADGELTDGPLFIVRAGDIKLGNYSVNGNPDLEIQYANGYMTRWRWEPDSNYPVYGNTHYLFEQAQKAQQQVTP